MLLVGVFLGEPSLRSTPASTSRISTAIYSRNHVPVFELNLNAPCDNPVTRDDLETIRKLVDLVPPFVERYVRMSELLRAVSGFKELAAYVRQHVEAVQRNQINGKLRAKQNARCVAPTNLPARGRSTAQNARWREE